LVAAQAHGFHRFFHRHRFRVLLLKEPHRPFETSSKKLAWKLKSATSPSASCHSTEYSVLGAEGVVESHLKWGGFDPRPKVNLGPPLRFQDPPNFG